MTEPTVSYTKLDRNPPERFQSLRRELGVEAFGMNLIVFQPGQRGRIHAHEHQEEVYMVLGGELTLIIDEKERVFGVDELVRVSSDVRRQLVNAGEQPLVLLALGGTGEHAGRDGRAWPSWDADGPGVPPQEVPLPEDLPKA
ncbi:MAG: cupin domain-containing protein [Solirubrobacteraceae bacterium]